MRKAIMIPAGCRERYVPLQHPAVADWRRGGTHHAGVSDLVPGYRIAIPDIRSIMLIATTAGAGWARTARERFALVPGTLLIGVPGDGIEFGIRGERWSMVWWYFRPLPLWQALITPRARLLPWAHGAATSALGDLLIARCAQGDELSRRMAGHAAGLIWLHLRELARAPAQDQGDAEGDLLDGLWRAVAERLAEPWPVAELARRACCSPATLQRLARRRLGCSVHRWLLRLRMDQARLLLQRTDYPLRVVAERVGYADPFTFSAAFRREAGVSPDAFRRAR